MVLKKSGMQSAFKVDVRQDTHAFFLGPATQSFSGQWDAKLKKTWVWVLSPSSTQKHIGIGMV